MTDEGSIRKAISPKSEWDADFAVLDEIGEAFAQIDPDEIEREVATVIAEIRSEM